MAAAAYAQQPGLRLVNHDLRSPGLHEALILDRAPDAVVSTTALHWLTLEQLALLYQVCVDWLAPGAVQINGDHLPSGLNQSVIDGLSTHVASTSLACAHPKGDDWQQWWKAVAVAPELADLAARSGGQPLAHSVAEEPSLADHRRLLLQVGFSEADTIWLA